ncbi:hypothetical protein LCGC14_1400230 [marine sediment metagenome]|uniref:Uncharacterized protein n=1 Tax=marine sediment metagenome TaxID=412755 RepID=A0A0F9KI81_9ZZZZ
MGVHLVTFQITDAGGNSKSIVIPCPDTATYTEIAAFVLEVDSLIDACISGIITNAQVMMSCPIDGGLNPTPADDMLVIDGGLLGFSATGTAYRSGLYIPTYANSLMGNDKDIPNTGATAALVTALIGGVNIDVSDKFENHLDAFLSGAKVHRK